MMMLFYVQMDKQGEIRISPLSEVDKPWQVLRPGLPLGFLHFYLQGLLPAAGTGGTRISARELEDTIVENLVKGLKKEGAALKGQFIWCPGENHFSGAREKNSDHRQLYKLKEKIQGRQITERELPALANRLQIDSSDLLKLMDEAACRGLGEWVPAVARKGKEWRCARCGSNRVEEWPSLYGNTATCSDCQILGAQTSLQAIFRMKAVKEGSENIPVNGGKADGELWGVDFTPAQAQAAEKLLEYSNSPGVREVLLWAACGAGKTEVSFPLISRYLAAGKKVLFAAPRQDVVHDVYPRLKKSFAHIPVVLLSGAVPPVYEASGLTVATTHQVLKFYRYFDLVILDEVDAYPYDLSAALKHGLKTALKEEGRIIYLTATPTEEMLSKTKRGQSPLVRLPVRHHGRPLPVPRCLKYEITSSSSFKRIFRGNHLHRLEELFSELLTEGPLLVFVPTVNLAGEWVGILKQMFPGKSIEGSWSSDPARRRKIELLQKQKYQIFVSTTILERGITLPNIQVIVLNADHELYDVRALVQMAGRAGRTADYPSGNVLFLASRETKAMKSARAWIEEQNSFLPWTGGQKC